MTETKNKTATVNACKLCMPLGACVALRGIRNAMPLIHGSQGCATYIRRYVISHFREPMDIASSSFSEHSTIFGGESNLICAIENVVAKYDPELIGIVTSCLSETIGEDVSMYVHRYRKNGGKKDGLAVIHIPTPSYSGTHMDGFYRTVRSAVISLSEKKEGVSGINLMPGFVSPADIRHLKEIITDFGLQCVVLPDYSETLDAPVLDSYKLIPDGGTTVGEIKSMGGSKATIEFGKSVSEEQSGGMFLEKEFGVERFNMHFPIGIKSTDAFFHELERLSGKKTPLKYQLERGRLIDSYVDGHKYIFGKKAVVYGEEDLVTGIAGFLSETGIIPALAASGGKSGRLEEMVGSVTAACRGSITVKDDVDFEEIGELAEAIKPDLIIGNSKGYKIARKLGIPLIRVGFPVHDRIGAQRIMSLGYRGTQNLFDMIVNALLEYKQENSDVGYSYL